MRPSRKSTQDCKSGERSEKSVTRRPHRLFHYENDTPVIVQAALLPIEISKPTISSSASHHQPPESTRRVCPSPSQPLESDFLYQRPRPPTLASPSASPSFLPPPPFSPSALQPAKCAPLEHIPQTTIPPPATVQEPITSTSYGGGQPAARATNSQMPPNATPQTPPYNIPLPSLIQPSASPQPQTQHHSPTQCTTQSQSPPYSQTQSQSQVQRQPEEHQTPIQSNQPYPQPRNPSYQSCQPAGQPGPQSRSRSQTQPQTIPAAQPQIMNSPQNPTQSRPQPAYPPTSTSPRLPFPGNRISNSSARNSSNSPQRISSYPPAKPVLPMPKPPPHLQHILQQQEEQRKQQQFFFMQQQLQNMQTIQQQVNAMLDEGPQRFQPEGDRQRPSSTIDSRPCDREREAEDTEIQSTMDNTRPSLKQRPRLNKRIVTVPAYVPSLRATPPTGTSGQPQPANGTPSTTATGVSTSPNQRICTVPPHPYGTIIPRFSTQHSFNISHPPTTPPMHLPTQIPLGYSAPPPRPDYLQNPLPGPTVSKPMTSNFGTNCYSVPSKPPEIPTRHTICQTDPKTEDLHEYTPRPQFPAKSEAEVRDEPSPEPQHQSHHTTLQPPENTLQQASQQTQGIQARLSHVQPLHSPALQTTHVTGSAQMVHNPQIKYQQMNNEYTQAKQEDMYMPAQSGYPLQPHLNRTSFNEKNSGQIILQQQQQSFQVHQWQQLQRQPPSPQPYIQLGTFPPCMANFVRPPPGAFVQNITDRPLKLSLPSQIQTSQLYPQNFSNVGVGIRSGNPCPGEVRIGTFHQGLMHGHRPGSPHHARARSAGRVSVSESTASVWGSNSNPHHLP